MGSQTWSSQYGRSWNLWHGAKSPKASNGPPWKKGGGKAATAKAVPKFPAFDARPRQSSACGCGLGGCGRGSRARSSEGTHNGARKAEARVARILRDKKKTEQQWQDYVRDSRAAYVKEHTRFLKAVDAFERDLAEATEQQKNARLLLRHATIQEELPIL